MADVPPPPATPKLGRQRSRSLSPVSRRSSETPDSGRENVRVFARVRPPNETEITKGELCLDCHADGRTVTLVDERGSHSFGFDSVFSMYTGQEEVYQAMGAPLVSGVLNGINAAIIAYGQTGSGKTFTMQGEPADLGIIPRMLTDLFDSISRDGIDFVYDVRASYIEIYQERLYDLLKTGEHRLGIFEDTDRSLIITNATTVGISSVEDALRAFNTGSKARTIAETKMNRQSSRGHAVFLLTIAKMSRTSSVTKYSQLYMVDLAGSEKVWKTGADGKRLDEAKYINKSLLALGNVIAKLSEQAPHVPYRDSKLTRLLQNSLGGNARTCLCVTLSPSEWNAQESLSALRFGQSSRRIRNQLRVNEVMGIAELEALLADTIRKSKKNESDISRLEAELAEFESFFSFMDVSAARLRLHTQSVKRLPAAVSAVMATSPRRRPATSAGRRTSGIATPPAERPAPRRSPLRSVREPEEAGELERKSDDDDSDVWVDADEGDGRLGGSSPARPMPASMLPHTVSRETVEMESAKAAMRTLAERLDARMMDLPPPSPAREESDPFLARVSRYQERKKKRRAEAKSRREEEATFKPKLSARAKRMASGSFMKRMEADLAARKDRKSRRKELMRAHYPGLLPDVDEEEAAAERVVSDIVAGDDARIPEPPSSRTRPHTSAGGRRRRRSRESASEAVAALGIEGHGL